MKALLALFIFVFALAANAAPASILSNVEFQSDHTLAVDIPDSQIITHVGKEGMAPLFQRFMDHYGQFVDPENPRELDFEFVMGFKNYETARQLEHLFYLALNEGQDMSAFKVFGIEVNGRTIKYSSLGHKIFRSPSDIFRSIAMASAPEHYKKYMTRIGLKMVDIIQIIQYCDNYGGNVMIDNMDGTEHVHHGEHEVNEVDLEHQSFDHGHEHEFGDGPSLYYKDDRKRKNPNIDDESSESEGDDDLGAGFD